MKSTYADKTNKEILSLMMIEEKLAPSIVISNCAFIKRKNFTTNNEDNSKVKYLSSSMLSLKYAQAMIDVENEYLE